MCRREDGRSERRVDKCPVTSRGKLPHRLAGLVGPMAGLACQADIRGASATGWRKTSRRLRCHSWRACCARRDRDAGAPRHASADFFWHGNVAGAIVPATPRQRLQAPPDRVRRCSRPGKDRRRNIGARGRGKDFRSSAAQDIQCCMMSSAIGGDDDGAYPVRWVASSRCRFILCASGNGAHRAGRASGRAPGRRPTAPGPVR